MKLDFHILVYNSLGPAAGNCTARDEEERTVCNGTAQRIKQGIRRPCVPYALPLGYVQHTLYRAKQIAKPLKAD